MTANDSSGEMRRWDVCPGWAPAFENMGCGTVCEGRDISHGILFYERPIAKKRRNNIRESGSTLQLCVGPRKYTEEIAIPEVVEEKGDWNSERGELD